MDDQSPSKRRILRIYSSLASFRQRLSDDWHGEKYFACGLLLLLLTLLPTILYYVNYPHVELNADTPAYLHVADRLRAQPYLLVDTWRLPGYPMLIMMVCMLAGRDNLMAVSVVQAALFVLTTLEIYVLAILLLRRAWLALFIGLLVGTNLVLLSYVKPIMAEGLAMCELTTLALATIYFLHSGRGFRYVALSLLLLAFTRPEWVYLAPLLFAYLLLMTARRGKLWHLCKKS